MKYVNGGDTKVWKPRLNKAIAAMVLAGALLGGAATAAQPDSISQDDTSETAWQQAYTSWGISWQ